MLNRAKIRQASLNQLGRANNGSSKRANIITRREEVTIIDIQNCTKAIKKVSKYYLTIDRLERVDVSFDSRWIIPTAKAIG